MYNVESFGRYFFFYVLNGEAIIGYLFFVYLVRFDEKLTMVFSKSDYSRAGHNKNNY